MSKRNREKRKMWVTSAKVQAHACAACGAVMTGVTYTEDKQDAARPHNKTGHIMVCSDCWACCVFVNETTTRLANPEDLSKVRPDQRKILELICGEIARRKQALARGELSRLWGGRT